MVRGRWTLALLAALMAQAAHAELYRCTAPDGTIRFTDDPTTCRAAAPYVPRRTLQRPTAPVAPSPAAPTPPRARWQGTRAELLSMLPPPPAGWEGIEEAPTDPRGDPDLWSNGVRTMAARHYTRARGAVSQSCSVEIWAFAEVDQAQRGERLLAQPGWKLHRNASLLIMLRAVTLERERQPRRGVFPDCEHIGALTRARVAERLP
jgi:hypothetical protein